MLSVLFVASVIGFFPTIVPAQETVKLAVYYESLCPDSDAFFHQQLSPTYEKLSNYLEVEIIPYGNARYSGHAGEYRFSCQHGPEECYGNMVQSCFITLYNNTAEQIKFINCAFDSHNQRSSLVKCIENVDQRRQVKKCVTSPMGNNLQYQMAKRTDALNPKQNFIPWITINGSGNPHLNDKVNKDLLSTLCDDYLKDYKPEACKKNKQKQFRNNYL